ncbi:beta-galactosidase [Enterococcus sp. RIT-PI-f]|uniref:beta-galactosidase n=1 Tax=Enterococcus sp. RIT-PI-f TaxID=1690244 RepID=UPI0006B98EE3|nr:beta-galactosidase [Enterococcus sp. RIT-PI-f]KPG73772.1 glycoside hydrolase family 42 [Enterococcus sp. RIT-PI-f]
MKILLAGDSTVADYPLNEAPMMGWGQALKDIMRKTAPQISVVNFAKRGATTRSFMEEGLYDSLLFEAASNDLALLQFGHNDQKDISDVSHHEYYQRMKTMVEKLLEKDVQVILCTPIERRSIYEGALSYTLKEYQAIIQRLAQNLDVPYFDLNQYTFLLYQDTGKEASKKYFVWGDPQELDHYPDGIQDNTHLNENGAYEVARYVSIRLRSYVSSEPLFTKLYYGACMYPEVWSPEIFEEDVAHLRRLKMNFARIGEFAWSSLEPEEGVYAMESLRYWLEVYQKQGIDVCLGIPTPTPPRWFTKKYPEACVKNSDGTQMSHGSRQHVCTNNPHFREKAYQLTRRIAAVAKTFDNVVAFQLDNEFKCHVDCCYCPSCQEKWLGWLAKEYQSIAFLNTQWGTQIWSEHYASFEEVILPTRTPFIHNSSLTNAFRKFTAQTINEFAHDSCHYIRMESDLPITHNTAFGFNLMNEELFSALDVAGFDTYPSPEDYPAYTLNLDTWRNVLRNRKEMLLLETCTSHVGHIENYVSPQPENFLPVKFFVGFAGNLSSFTFWHFRGHRYGVEQTHSAVITSWGEPDLGYAGVIKCGELLEELSPSLSTSEYVSAKIALLYSDNAKRFYQVETGGRCNHRSLVTEYYGSMIKAGVSVEVIQEGSLFEPYDLILAPFVRGISPTLLKKCQDFVEGGGKLILGPMTGDRTMELSWPEKNGLDILGEWLELNHIQQQWVETYPATISTNDRTESMMGLTTTFSGTNWEALALFENNKNIMAKKKIGNGEVIYCGGLPIDLRGSLLWHRFIQKEIAPFDQDHSMLNIEEGIVKYRRETATEIYLYLGNLGSSMAHYRLKMPAKDLLKNSNYPMGDYQLEGYEYRILVIKKYLESDNGY